MTLTNAADAMTLPVGSVAFNFMGAWVMTAVDHNKVGEAAQFLVDNNLNPEVYTQAAVLVAASKAGWGNTEYMIP